MSYKYVKFFFEKRLKKIWQFGNGACIFAAQSEEID